MFRIELLFPLPFRDEVDMGVVIRLEIFPTLFLFGLGLCILVVLYRGVFHLGLAKKKIGD